MYPLEGFSTPPPKSKNLFKILFQKSLVEASEKFFKDWGGRVSPCGFPSSVRDKPLPYGLNY